MVILEPLPFSTSANFSSPSHSYAESIDTYFEEEEFRYLLPLKEYITYCDSLRF